MESNLVYREQQRFRQWWLWVIILGLTIFWIGLILISRELVVVLLALILDLGLIVFMYNLKLDTEVIDTGVRIKFWPFHRKWVLFEFSNIESVEEFEKAVPMMMTAAGTIIPAKVLVIGAGVAGLQAIATAKRLGAIVFATDVRIVAKEQVESLGGTFLSVDGAENLETAGGYAKEAGEDFKKKQAELLKNSIKKSDIVICTALIPGKKAPRIISEDMVKSMKYGSIIYDLAASQGGNSAFSASDKINIVNGVKIIGAKNILNKLALTASNLYAKNLFNFVNNLYNKEKKDIYINEEDEIISKTLIG